MKESWEMHPNTITISLNANYSYEKFRTHDTNTRIAMGCPRYCCVLVVGTDDVICRKCGRRRKQCANSSYGKRDIYHIADIGNTFG